MRSPLWLSFYCRWKLGGDINFIVHCEHDGIMTGTNGGVSFINIKTLNKWDSRHCSGVDWMQKLDSQCRAVIATELKNNSYKLNRWTCCALLAGSEYLKLGYVSRYQVKGSSRHVILGTQQFKPNGCQPDQPEHRECLGYLTLCRGHLREAGGGQVPHPQGPQQADHLSL